MQEDILNVDFCTELPLVALRGLSVFPEMILHFDVGRPKSISALKAAVKESKKVFLVSQKDVMIEEPTEEDLYKVGVICDIKQVVNIPNSSNARVAVEGLVRARLINIVQNEPYFKANAEILNDILPDESELKYENAYEKLVKREFEKYISLVPRYSESSLKGLLSITQSGELADFIASNSYFENEDKQAILECLNPIKRLVKVYEILVRDNENLQTEAEIQEKVRAEIDSNQREYFLREEMKIIADELGESEDPVAESDIYRKKIEKLNCSQEIKDKLYSECNKLMKMPLSSQEATVSRNYLDKCLEIPFNNFTKDSINLDKARKVLDKEHYSLEKIKDRIVEHLAVMKRNPDFNGQIICLYGPPGVGKTSIVKSLAKAMNRNYVRIALGGVHDESEIRGHRRTYIGSMPGRIIDALIKSKSMNPVILLDEIDKVGSDYKGDPSSALLEALDPEQNFSFEDHYIDFPVDLSNVLFMTTANDLSTIPEPLYDRMEVIELNSYSVTEKFNIAKKHLIKKQMLKHNITSKKLKVTDKAIYSVIENYTSEAGVRELERKIAEICRKAIMKLENSDEVVRVSEKNISEFLGIKKYFRDKVNRENQVGVVNGLAWTKVGGTLLPIEVSALNGTGKIEITGNLGDVMTESAKTAVSYVRSKSDEWGISSDFYKNKDIHIHAPEAAIPKDGPSAGLAITTAIVSELTSIPIKQSVAMTGEISLKGKALAIGGLKEKSMAAYKSGCKTVIIPYDNEKDLFDVNEEVKNNVEFITVKNFDEVLEIALEKNIKNCKIKHIIKSNCSVNSSTITQ